MKNGFHILPASCACRIFLACAQCFALCAGAPAAAAPPAAPPPAAAPVREHREFDAMLEAAFPAPPAGQPRTFILHFTLPGASAARRVDWTLGLYRPNGALLRQWRGRHVIRGGDSQATVTWQAPPALAPGIYDLRLQSGAIRQRRPIAVGLGAAQSMAGAPAGVPRLAGLPFAIAYGNLHSQTNHSDGGGDPATCHGAQAPRSGAFGPADAFQFAQAHGLDFLMASEHNHMYDGSDASAPTADPHAARQLYRQGLASAQQYTARHPGFVALYGMEWGVISGGGHLNILNSPALLGWERSADGEPFADVVTARNDYGALYALMKAQGWLGQFNHPAASQFAINGRPLAFSEDGGAVMALCEIMNSNAFSNRLDESEPRHSFYEDACNRLLEAGYRLAFSSGQDNHCANWGASYGNRTALLLPAGAPFTADALLGAVRARHAFATMDKHAAIALTANGAMMGAQIENRGALVLQVHYASSAGRSIAALDIMEGVPGRHGQVTLLPGAGAMRRVLQPRRGRHFYYARITQDDGNMLWSAPVWVNQL